MPRNARPAPAVRRRLRVRAVLAAALAVLAASVGLAWPAGALPAQTPAAALVPSGDGNGYVVLSTEGKSYAYGSDARAGVLPDHVELSAPAVGSATAADGGSWIATRDGGVLPVGGAPALGSLAGRTPEAPVVDLVATPSHRGYWLLTAAGRVAPFGDARDLGSLATLPHAGDVVALAPTPSGGGYWLATSTGEVHPFGDAPVLDAPPVVAPMPPALPSPVVALVASESGRGWLTVAEDGSTRVAGDYGQVGSFADMHLTSPVVAAAPYAGGRGVWLLQRNGGVVALHAPFYGAVTDEKNPRPKQVLAPWYAGGQPTVDGAAGGLVAIRCSGGTGVIVVSAVLARPVADLLAAAARDGVGLCGTSSFRNSQQQIALRAAYCTSVFDPAATCSRPVALPGRSLHEQGLAVDFSADGAGYAWLASHADAFGLHHLAAFGITVEPWHYSVDGG